MTPQAQLHPRLVGDDDPLEISVADHVMTLWRRRWMILLVTALVAAGTVGALSLVEPEYRATAKLVVLPTVVGDRSGQLALVQSAIGDRAAAQLEQIYQTLAASHDVAAAAISALGLDKPPRVVAPQLLVQNHLNISGSNESGIIEFEAKMWTADLAARLANEMARQLVNAARKLTAGQLASTASTLQEQVQTAQARLTDIETRLTTANQDSGVDLLQTDVTSRLALRKELPGLAANIETEKARLGRAQEQLGTQERVRANPRAVDGGPPLDSDGGSGLILRPDSLNPYINPVYESLNQQIANSATSLAGLEKRRAELVDVLRVAGDADPHVRALYAKKAAIEALQRDYEIARTAYIAVAARHQEATLRLAGQAEDIRVIDSAAVPLRRSSPRIVRNTAIWSAIGFLFACVWALASKALSDTTSRPSPATFAVKAEPRG
jgi:capsular polysaccharide biosynthesis protein